MYFLTGNFCIHLYCIYLYIYFNVIIFQDIEVLSFEISKNLKAKGTLVPMCQTHFSEEKQYWLFKP
jgi:hypothetical protein